MITGRRITRREIIRTVLEKWRRSYWNAALGVWRSPARKLQLSGLEEPVHVQLARLDLDTCSPEDVNRIIGDSLWTDLACGACGAACEIVVCLEDPDDDHISGEKRLCLACVYKHALAPLDCVEDDDCRAHPTTLGRACAASKAGVEL